MVNGDSMSKRAAALRTVTESSRQRVRLLDRRGMIDSVADERAALVDGILAYPAVISPKYFYDDIGCTLFEAICRLQEYYPTRTERAILDRYRDAIVEAVGTGGQFVDLGAGDCAKAALLLPALHPRRYVAVDIAAEAIEPALSRLTPAFPRVELMGVVTDFSRRFDLAGAIEAGPVTFFYPGSSIGNFTPDEARSLLRRVRDLCGSGSGLLIGVDTKKEKARLDAAYNDALGVTAAFNLNVLNHVNRIVGSDFSPAGFAHVAFYEPIKGRVEMHLESRHVQRVRVDGRERLFAAGERVHTENSYKYSPVEFASLLRSAGFDHHRLWQDEAGDFAVFYAS
jgi:dimethylhistidine N-methyltransferase